MKPNYSYPGWTKRAALVAASLCVAATAAHAQGTLTTYGTTFDGPTDTVNGSPSGAGYVSPNTPTDPLDGQNGWGTNDGTQTGAYGTSAQLVGRSDYVGTTAYFTGQQGALGGVYRSTAGSGAAPDVVPSTASGGIVSLYHSVGTISPIAPYVALNVDFAVTAPGANGFASHDTFSFALQTAGLANLISINFAPSQSNPNGQDVVTYTVGNGTAVSTNNLITLNGTTHLTLTVQKATNTFTAQLIDTGVGGNSTSFSGSLAASGLTLNNIGDAVALWNLADKTTIANGGYQNAGDNALVFDNLAVTVPEPSTYAMMALGLAGLGVLLRRKVA